MRFGLIGLLSPFVALPLAYFPFKNNYLVLKASTRKERPEHGFEKKYIDLDTSDWFDWIYKLSWDDSISDAVSIRKQKSSYDDFKQGLIGYLGTYLFFKIFAKVTRTLTFLSLVSILLYKIVIATGFFDQLLMMISTEKYLKMCLVKRALRDVWDSHKPYIGDYIEKMIITIVDAPISDCVINLSSLLGFFSYFVIG